MNRSGTCLAGRHALHGAPEFADCRRLHAAHAAPTCGLPRRRRCRHPGRTTTAAPKLLQAWRSSHASHKGSFFAAGRGSGH